MGGRGPQEVMGGVVGGLHDDNIGERGLSCDTRSGWVTLERLIRLDNLKRVMNDTLETFRGIEEQRRDIPRFL